MFRWNTLAIEYDVEKERFKFHYVQMEPEHSGFIDIFIKSLNSTTFRWNDPEDVGAGKVIAGLNSTMFRWNLQAE